MFDIGFWELALVGLVSLLVIGPKRLPGVVRVVGFWLGKARRTVASVKQELREELYAEDLRQTLAEKSPAKELHSLIDDTKNAIADVSAIDFHSDLDQSGGTDSRSESNRRS